MFTWDRVLQCSQAGLQAHDPPTSDRIPECQFYNLTLSYFHA